MVKVWKSVQEYASKIIGDDKASDLVAYLKHCWNGKEMLWKIFWIYAVAVNFALTILFVAPMAATGGRLAESIALLVIAPFVLWSLKSTWVSAENIENPEFKGIPRIYLSVAAKFAVVLMGVNYLLALLG